MKKIAIFGFLVIIFFTSCKEKHYYEESVEIPESSWNMEDVAQFSVKIDDISVPYNLSLKLQHEKTYPYNNLWLFIRTTAPSGNVRFDTLNCILTNEDYSWKGKSSKNSYTYIAPFRDSIAFIDTGLYKFEIQHALRQEQVPMINKIGFVIDKLSITSPQ